MNKYQEAINYFVNRDEGDNLTVTCDWLINAEALKELVDKETPMKTIFSKELGVTTCGSCKKYLVSSNNWIPKYCSECGHKIDWGNEE